MSLNWINRLLDTSNGVVMIKDKKDDLKSGVLFLASFFVGSF